MDLATTPTTPTPAVSYPDRPAGAEPRTTELPAHKVVGGAADASGAARPQAEQPSDSWAERRILIDPGTQDLIIQTVDARTNEVTAQLPDRAALGRRAYIDSLTRREDQAARERGAALPALIA